MHDARDAEDKRLLEAGEHKLLLAAYFHPVRERCFLRLRDREAGDELAQRIFLRLLAELRRGKTYSVPLRVVVWMVVEFSARGFFPGAKEEATLSDDWDPGADDAFAEWEADYDLGLLLADLPPWQREVAELRWREGLNPAEVAERLGMKPGAVYVALHHAHKKLTEKLGE